MKNEEEEDDDAFSLYINVKEVSCFDIKIELLSK